MQTLRKDDPVPERPVVILIHGDPGTGKTSLSFTSSNPFHVDYDRGFDRGITRLRPDVGRPKTWDDVLSWIKSRGFDDYQTIINDTAKAMLDDFAAEYVIRKSDKNATNSGTLSLKGYGAIADQFKMNFLNPLRQSDKDIVFICHSKDEKNGEESIKVPDVTGGTYSLLLRVADMIGYLHIKNGQRVLSFTPSDKWVSKDVAGFGDIIVPDDIKDPDNLNGFMAGLIQRLKDRLVEKSSSLIELENRADELTKEIESFTEPEQFTEILSSVNNLPKYLRVPIRARISELITEHGMFWNEKKSAFDRKHESMIQKKDQPEKTEQGEMFPTDSVDEENPEKEPAKRTSNKTRQPR